MTPLTHDIGPVNILIVDDHPDNLVVMEAVLKESPEYHLVTASSGPEAIELVKQMDFALILMDVQMPGMDGYQTASHIKELEGGKDIPIMMVTAIYNEDPHILKGYSVGAIDYVGKPFNPDILKAKVGVYANLYLKSRQIIRQNKYLMDAEKVLKEQRNARAILETMPVGVIAADKEEKIYEMNMEACKIWSGTSAAFARCSEFAGWWPKTGVAIQPHEWAIARALEKGETSQYEIIDIRCLDGSRKTVLNSASPIRGAEGGIIGAVGVMQDITQQQDIEAKLHQLCR